jgi:predicted MPP superfamily phosphohydrolase
MERRKFIRNLGMAGISLAGGAVYAFEPSNKSGRKKLKIGWITDVHHGYCTDASDRLKHFIAAARKQQPDFILQGGDFCHPTGISLKERNTMFWAIMTWTKAARQTS